MMKNCFILLSAGKGRRFRSNIPKQYIRYKGLMMFEHSLKKAINSKLFKLIILVISKSHRKYMKDFNNEKVKIIYGGNKRHKSSLFALKYAKKFKPSKVIIHDAARPDFSLKLLKKLVDLSKRYKCIIPYIKPVNSLKLKHKKKIINLNRSNIYETQTPQCFDFNSVYNLSIKNKKIITDESSLFLNNNLKVNFINGEENNKKITNKSDLIANEIINYGIGFDVHRLVPNRRLYLGGLIIKSKLGTLGHSDGDPVLHAVTDALLGACKMGDIGQVFSDKNNKFKNIRSTKLLKRVIKKVKKKKYTVNNIDINIISEKPKIAKYKDKMTKLISNLCETSEEKINIKGKTAEKLGLIGKEKAIACEVIASVIKNG